MESRAFGEDFESTHVHEVYDQIASHFSSTRYKVCLSSASILRQTAHQKQPWPIVERFLLDQPDGSIGLDLGCGNGKYLSVNPKVFMLASDRCAILSIPVLACLMHSKVSQSDRRCQEPSATLGYRCRYFEPTSPICIF